MLLAFVLFYVGQKFFAYILFPRVDVKNEKIEKDNQAFILAYVGFNFTLLIIIIAVIYGPSHGLQVDVFNILYYGLLAILCLGVGRFFAPFKLSTVKHELLQDRNLGMGFIFSAQYISSALVLAGAMMGESSTLQAGTLSLLSFYFASLLVAFLIFKLYEFITPFKFSYHVLEKDNVPVSIAFSCMQIAISVLLMDIIRHDLDTLLADWLYYITKLLIGLILIPLLRFSIDRLILRGGSLVHEMTVQDKPNIGVGLIEGSTYILVSIFIVFTF